LRKRGYPTKIHLQKSEEKLVLLIGGIFVKLIEALRKQKNKQKYDHSIRLGELRLQKKSEAKCMLQEALLKTVGSSDESLFPLQLITPLKNFNFFKFSSYFTPFK
jgi:hypothetical protein